jgi:DNA polymerase-3 subunit delta'
MVDVFADLVGQDEAVATLRRAAASAAALVRAAAPARPADTGPDELDALAEEFDPAATAPADRTGAGGDPGAGTPGSSPARPAPAARSRPGPSPPRCSACTAPAAAPAPAATPR